MGTDRRAAFSSCPGQTSLARLNSRRCTNVAVQTFSSSLLGDVAALVGSKPAARTTLLQQNNVQRYRILSSSPVWLGQVRLLRLLRPTVCMQCCRLACTCFTCTFCAHAWRLVIVYQRVRVQLDNTYGRSQAGCTACIRGRRGMATRASASGGKRISQNEFTEKAWQSIIAAPDIAQNASQQIVDTEHLFKALLEQPNGLARRILAKAGSNPTQLLEKTDQYIRQQPRVTGDSSQVGLLTHQPVLFCMCQRALSDLAAAAVLT